MSEVLGWLWGAQVEGVHVDVLGHRVALGVWVREGESVSAHRVTASRVAAVEYTDATDGPWLRVEAAEVYAEEVPGGYQLEIWLNDMDNRLTLIAEEVEADGEVVLPSRGVLPGVLVEPVQGDAEPGTRGSLFSSLHVDVRAKRAEAVLLAEEDPQDPLADLRVQTAVWSGLSQLSLRCGDTAPWPETRVDALVAGPPGSAALGLTRGGVLEAAASSFAITALDS